MLAGPGALPFDEEDHAGTERASAMLDTALRLLSTCARAALVDGGTPVLALLELHTTQVQLEMTRSLALAEASSAARAARRRRTGGSVGHGVDMLGGGSEAAFSALKSRAEIARARTVDAIMTLLAATKAISGAQYAAFLAQTLEDGKADGV